MAGVFNELAKAMQAAWDALDSAYSASGESGLASILSDSDGGFFAMYGEDGSGESRIYPNVAALVRGELARMSAKAMDATRNPESSE